MKVTVSILAIFLLLCVMWIIPFDVPTDIRYWQAMVFALGVREVPSFTDGYNILEHPILASGKIATFPVRWMEYCCQQGVVIYKFMTGNVEVTTGGEPIT